MIPAPSCQVTPSLQVFPDEIPDIVEQKQAVPTFLPEILTLASLLSKAANRTFLKEFTPVFCGSEKPLKSFKQISNRVRLAF